MAWVYEHLPSGFSRVVLDHPHGFVLVSSKKCPNISRSCPNKATAGSCCLGVKSCQYKDCHNGGYNNDAAPVPLEGGIKIAGAY